MGWALIAGGSRGIGFSIAEALASNHFNLLLIARNPEDLHTAKIRLEKNYRINVEIIACDLALTESSSTIVDFCLKKELDLKILCNAAGLGGSRDFPDLTLDDLQIMIRTNLESAITLSFLFLPILKINAPAFILNVGSMAGFAPFPMKNVYSASKAGLLYFSYSLHQQLRDSNISVSCLCPGPVFTKPEIEQETIKKLGWLGKKMAVDPKLVGELAVRGMFLRKKGIIPGKLAKLISFLLRVLPSEIIASMIYKSGKTVHE
jgi:short-subunit dehydrogenase